MIKLRFKYGLYKEKKEFIAFLEENYKITHQSNHKEHGYIPMVKICMEDINDSKSNISDQ